ncbi:MAG: FAD-dependent oxidoreductase [Bacillota bacterium]
MSKILLNIDGKEIKAYQSQTILEVCKANQIEIPTLCHNEELKNYGSCGLCVVEVEGVNKLLRACSTEAKDGMIIKTYSDRIKESRKTTLELLLSDHTGDCKAPCSLGCPGEVDVQGYVGLIANNQIDEALKLIKEKLPLPASIGRVCPHPCQSECRRGILEDSIAIAWLKRYAADMDLEKINSYLPDIKKEKNKKVSIIGGGPGGLSAAYFLRKKGYKVVIYEAMAEFGGMLKYGIPLYRLPKDILQLEIKLIESMGVKLVPNTRVGKDISLDHIREQSDATFISVGAWESAIIPCKGHKLNRVHGGIEFLNKFAINDPIKVGQKIAVIGGGNTAMDAARTSIRLGAQKVYAIYRRTKDDMPAVDVEIKESMEEGVEFEFLLNPVEIIGEDGNVSKIKLEKMKPIGKDKRGRTKIEKTGKFKTIEVDSVIMSIGQKLNNKGFEDIELNEWGNIKSDLSTWQTNLEDVFAGGDCINDGADIAISAIYDGRQAASMIDSYLHGEITPKKDLSYVKQKNLTLKDFPNIDQESRKHMTHESPERRKHNFEEVVHGFSEKEALGEANRCLECGCNEVFKCDLVDYGNEFDADFERFIGQKDVYRIDERNPYILKDSNKCINCNMCIRTCEEILDIGALGMVNRGFNTNVLPALDKKLSDTECIECGRCIDVCPTGALQEKMPIKKQVPLKADIVHTTCSSCSIGCKIKVEKKGDLLLKALPNPSDRTSKGVLCKKGKFDFSVATNEERILKPRVRKNGKLETVSFEEAILYVARKAQSMDLIYDKNTFGVAIGGKLTNEEIFLAKSYAQDILQTENIFNIHKRKSGLKEVIGVDVSTNTLNEICHTDAILVFNADLMNDYTITALKVKSAYENGAKIININTKDTKVSDWADETIITDNGTKILRDIYVKNSKYSEVLEEQNKLMFIFDEENSTYEQEKLIGLIARRYKHIGSPRNGIIKLRKNINSQGLVDIGVSIDKDKYLEKINKGDIKGLLLLDDKMPSDEILEKLEFVAVLSTHLDEKTKKADVILPKATLLESEGTITTADRRIERVNKVLDPITGFSNLDIIKELMNVYSTNADYKNPNEIFLDIVKDVEIYDGYNFKEQTIYWPVKSTRILFEDRNIFDLPEIDLDLYGKRIEKITIK